MTEKPSKDVVDRYKSGCLDGVFTGFIPCSKHAQEVLSGKIKLNDLIQDRDEDLFPFPIEFG